MKKRIIYWNTLISLLVVLMNINGWSQEPAAKIHARVINGVYLKATTKLKSVAHFNFAWEFAHPQGRGPVISELTKFGDAHGFAVETYGNGSTPQNITFENLSQNQVIFSNNTYNMAENLSSSERTSVEQAIKLKKVGYLAVHGAVSEAPNWSWFVDNVDPNFWRGHKQWGSTTAPIYAAENQEGHLALEGFFENISEVKNVPIGYNESGGVQRAERKVLNVINEWYRYRDDLEKVDSLTGQAASVLLKLV